MYPKFWIKKIIGFIICVLMFGTLLSYVVMILWNNVAVDVLHLPVISFWQAVGLLILSKILFGGIHGGWRGGKEGHWRKEMHEKWHNMTPEEREKIKQEWRSRCSVWGKRDNDPTAGAE